MGSTRESNKSAVGEQPVAGKQTMCLLDLLAQVEAAAVDGLDTATSDTFEQLEKMTLGKDEDGGYKIGCLAACGYGCMAYITQDGGVDITDEWNVPVCIMPRSPESAAGSLATHGLLDIDE